MLNYNSARKDTNKFHNKKFNSKNFLVCTFSGRLYTSKFGYDSAINAKICAVNIRKNIVNG